MTAERRPAPLVVEDLGDGRWKVSGGSQAHLLELYVGEGLRCDCKGFRFYGRCRHVAAVNRFESGSAPDDAGGSPDPAPGGDNAGPGLVDRDVPPAGVERP